MIRDVAAHGRTALLTGIARSGGLPGELRRDDEHAESGATGVTQVRFSLFGRVRRCAKRSVGGPMTHNGTDP